MDHPSQLPPWSRDGVAGYLCETSLGRSGEEIISNGQISVYISSLWTQVEMDIVLGDTTRSWESVVINVDTDTGDPQTLVWVAMK